MTPFRARAGLRLATVLLLSLALAGCKQELLTALSQRQANESIAMLQRHGISAGKESIGKNQFRIEVERRDFANAVSLLTQYQLPSQDDMTIADLFPSDSFVSSPTTDRLRLISGLEQRLAQTARAIDHVLSARVHISYPLSGDDHADPLLHVAVMLNYDGSLADTMLIQQFKQLVKNSFEDVNYDNISVVVFHAPPMPSVTAPNTATPWPSQSVGWLICALLALVAAASATWHWRERHKPTPTITPTITTSTDRAAT